jgi:hypothetical protein
LNRFDSFGAEVAQLFLGFSTPSASNVTFNPFSNAVIALIIVWFLGSFWIFVTNDLSIFILSSGKFFKYDSDEYPVPKSSIAMEKPFCLNSRNV